jgi:hypothetical protein
MTFPVRPAYETIIYGLPERYADQVIQSTLRLYSTSALTARLDGSIWLANGLEIRIREFVDFKMGKILDYSYTIYRGSDKIRWYDPQPHPEEPTLTATFPHHYHAEPDIKHHRLPAPGISFQTPNLEQLIADCPTLV